MRETTFGQMWIDSPYFAGIQDGYLVVFNDCDVSAATVFPVHCHQIIVKPVAIQ